MAFTAVYFRGPQGYVGFVEELPGVNSHGRTIEEARAAVVFEAERAQSAELLAGKEVVREEFRVDLPRRQRPMTE
jgi:predicted RNase H-like HicB family nuclease